MDNYEEKYKAALGWMRSLYGGLHGATKEEAEKYFPELKESEDDKIREKIMNLVKKSNEQGGYALQKWEADDMLAWLEKQGEHKPYGQRKECEDCQFNYAGECKGYCALKRNEQPTDKVEPKFKVSDWLQYRYAEPFLVEEITEQGYW